MSCLGTKLRSFAKEHTYYKAAVLYPFYFFTNVITMQDLLEEECTDITNRLRMDFLHHVRRGVSKKIAKRNSATPFRLFITSLILMVEQVDFIPFFSTRVG